MRTTTWQLHPETINVLTMRGDHDPSTNAYGAVAPFEKGLTGDICTSIAYRFESAEEGAAIFAGTKQGYAYPRINCGTPPNFELSQRLLDLELGPEFPFRDQYDVLLTASGMSAIFLLTLALASEGGEFISSPYLYGGTSHLFSELLPKLHIYCHMIKDPRNLSQWDSALDITPGARFLYAEDDANPTPFKLDNSAIAAIAHKHGKLYVCDRTVGTPHVEQPIHSGTDVVIHSLSKNIGGYSAGLGGAIIAKKKLIQVIRDEWHGFAGMVMDPRVADYMLAGLKDFKERMERKITTTKQVVEFLENHPCVKRLYHSGSDLISFEIHGTLDHARRVVEAYELIIHTPHLGDIWTLSVHPASTTHSSVLPQERVALGISDTLIRVAIGLEHPSDIIADLGQALEKGRVV